MNIIILYNSDKLNENHYEITDERFSHVKNILKANLNDVIEVGLLNGPTGIAKIIGLTDTSVNLEIIQLHANKQLLPNIDIICALPRPQTLKKVLGTCATMGVTNLYLIRSEKVEKSYFHSPLLEENNYTKYLIEGLSQGKRTILPKVSIHKRFKAFFEKDFKKINKDKIFLLAHPDAENYLSNFSLSGYEKIVLAIGPEGGWNDFELNFMEDLGFVKYKLSQSILRVENAVTAAVAQVELMLQSK